MVVIHCQHAIKCSKVTGTHKTICRIRTIAQYPFRRHFLKSRDNNLLFLGTEQSTVTTYLYTAVRNKCVDHLRHNLIKAEYADYYLKAVDACYQDDEAEAAEKERCVEEMLARLPAQTSHILKECYLNRKKYKEVADELGVCNDTVKRHIMRALKYLRGLYSGKKD